MRSASERDSELVAKMAGVVVEMTRYWRVEVSHVTVTTRGLQERRQIWRRSSVGRAEKRVNVGARGSVIVMVERAVVREVGSAMVVTRGVVGTEVPALRLTGSGWMSEVEVELVVEIKIRSWDKKRMIGGGKEGLARRRKVSARSV